LRSLIFRLFSEELLFSVVLANTIKIGMAVASSRKTERALRNCIKVWRALILRNSLSILTAVSFSDCLAGLNENSEQAKYNLCLLYGLLSAIYTTAGDIRRRQPIHCQYKERYMCRIITVNKDIINVKLLFRAIYG